MVNGLYDQNFLDKIKTHKISQKEIWIPKVDCAFCGYRCDKKPRSIAKISPQGLLTQFPCTIELIFKKVMKNHTRACNFCFNLINTANYKLPESKLMTIGMSKLKLDMWKEDQVSTNQKPTNDKSPSFNKGDQSESPKDILLGMKRHFDAMSVDTPPSKDPVQAEQSYHVLFTKNGVKVHKEQNLFLKMDKGPGKPGIGPVMVDLVSDSIVHGGVSATKSSIQKTVYDKHLLGREAKRGKAEWSPQSSLRCLSIKYHASDVAFCNWMCAQQSLFAGFDGATALDRHFIEFHLTGVDKKNNVSKQLLKIVELPESTTGAKMAQLFCSLLDDLVRVAIKNSIPITTLLSIHGVTYDTTSTNTGEFGGIVAKLDEARKKLWETVQANLPEENRRPYPELLKIACCDHVASLFMVHFLKEVVITLKDNGYQDLVQGDRCILVPMFESFGNMWAGADGNNICSAIRADVDKNIFKPKLPVSFQNVDSTRYLSLPVLVEKYFHFEKYVNMYMEKELLANTLSDVQKRYWLLWKTSPVLRGIAKFVVLAKNEYMQPTMREGNNVHKWTAWKTYLENLLSKATAMRHSRCTDLADEIEKTFATLNLSGIGQTVRPILRKLNIVLGNAIIFVCQKWYGDIISSTDKSEKWIVATNRESERFISILKQCLHDSTHTRELIINAKMRLRFLNFEFVNLIPEDKQQEFIRTGRKLYDDHKTRKEVNAVKKEAHDKAVAEAMVKFAQKMRETSIFTFLQSCGAPVQPKLSKKPGKDPKLAVTVEGLKEFLAKLKRHSLYDGEVNQRTKNDYMVVVETVLMPRGATIFRPAYTNQ